MSHPRIIPVFFPSMGCPNRCVYCDQALTATRGLVEVPDACAMEPGLRSALSRGSAELPELAFFGGTFTGLPGSLQLEWLKLGERLVREGLVRGLRLSTHPARVGPAVLDFLKTYPVTTVELGVQSFQDEVLAASGRGCTRLIALEACRRVMEWGFELVVQLMPGLPLAGVEDDLDSASLVVDLNADMARIYPTLVVRGTELESMMRRGLYAPLGLDAAVERTAEMVSRLEAGGVRVIRVGLLEQPGLDQAVVAGPRHQAFGELVEIEKLAKELASFLRTRPLPEVLIIPESRASHLLGHGRRGVARLKAGLARQDWNPLVKVVRSAAVGELTVNGSALLIPALSRSDTL